MVNAILIGIISVVLLTAGLLLSYRQYNKHVIKKTKAARSQAKHQQNVKVAKEKLGLDEANAKINPKEDNFKHLRHRFNAIGVFVIGAFSILAAKLYSIQIVNGESYRKQAKANATTTIYTPAPRGFIYDADGVALVKNRSSMTVLADPEVASDEDVLRMLSTILGLPLNIVKNRVIDQTSGSKNRRVIASDITHKQAAYIAERSYAMSGVTVESRTVRDYPYGALAAHLLGYTGTVSTEELAEPKDGLKIQSGDMVGKSGVESVYNNLLSGDHGQRIVVSDADGNIISIKEEIQPTKGSDINLTIRGTVQYVADKLLAETIAPEGIIGAATGGAGSIVVMDVTDGSIIAMANYPTYWPSAFTNGISQETWNLYNTEESHYPLLNRSIAGTYPPASTFKAFSGLAGLEYGFTTRNTFYNCTGSWDGWNNGYVQKCWKTTGHGSLSFRQGIVDSCDIVFYEIGKKFTDNANTIGANAMQEVIAKYGFGQLTNIDLEGELAGRLPTKEWKAEYFMDVPTEASWLGGDETNMTIGQGYTLITPLQLAVAYGGIATGRTLKPHVFKNVKDDSGKVVASKQTEVLNTPDVGEYNVEVIRDALHGVATENYSVSSQFRGVGLDVAAKTGTAEVANKKDFAWTAAYGPYDNPKYVAVGIIEEGGGGSSAVTPIVAQVLKAAFDADAGTIDKNIGVVAGSTGKSVKIDAESKRTD